MPKSSDVSTAGASLFLLPIRARVPLKFGPETVTEVTCARVCLRVRNRSGRVAEGWGETPLSVQWVWPGTLPYALRLARLTEFCRALTRAWAGFEAEGHAVEIGHDFQSTALPSLLREHNAKHSTEPPMPWLAALVCCSAFDLALHDAFGRAAGRDVYQTYTAEFLSRDLAGFLEPADGTPISFVGKYPSDFLVANPPSRLEAWHLVGGLDALEPSELTGSEPRDEHPVLLRDWIRRDGLKCLKIKLRGNDAAWDYERMARVGGIALEERVEALTADFNCTVREPEYVNNLLDRLAREHPRIHEMLLYVEQPFPYELEELRLDVRSVARRKPLFLDESAHDWKFVRLGRELGWTGVALKTCKTQTGALLSCAWARAHGMQLMVQDLSNPMLAQIPHLRLAAHVGTIRGVETNGMQFYPDASLPEAAVHPGCYQRRNGRVDLSTLQGAGFGYRLDEIQRELPEPVAACGDIH